MIKKILLVLLVTMTLILSACGGSSSTYTYIIDDSYTDFLIMGTSADYPPFEWPGKVDGKITIVGIDIEIAKAIAKNEGKNLKVINKSFDFLLEDLENGKLDFVMAGMSATAEREKRVAFSIPYYNDGQALLINKKNINVFNSIEDFNKKTVRIGAQIGSIQQEIVEELFTISQTKFVKSVAELVSNLSDNRIEGLLVEVPVAQSYVKNAKDLIIANIDFSKYEDNGFGVAVNKQSTKLLANINDVILQLKTSGQLDSIIKAMIELNN